jgi:hypothetical protein
MRWIAMLSLSLLEVHWLDAPEPLDDQCAHGTVLLSVDGHSLVTPQDGELTVCAAALNLLRTLEHDHTPERPVSEGGQLFPCCGFNVWVAGERFPVLIVGCPTGVDLQVAHAPEGVALRANGFESLVPEHEWRCAVVSFAEAVLAFYEREPPRNPIEDAEDRKGWQAFWQEYSDRLERYRVAI